MLAGFDSDMMVATAASPLGGSLEVSLSTTTLSKTKGTRTGPVTVTTATVTATATGGAGGYTYAWARVSGDANVAATAATTATTAFSYVNMPVDTTALAAFHVTVTDANGGTVISPNVNVDLHCVDTSIGGGTL